MLNVGQNISALQCVYTITDGRIGRGVKCECRIQPKVNKAQQCKFSAERIARETHKQVQVWTGCVVGRISIMQVGVNYMVFH